MRFAVSTPNFGTGLTAAGIGDLAASAEQAGWDGFFLLGPPVRLRARTGRRRRPLRRARGGLLARGGSCSGRGHAAAPPPPARARPPERQPRRLSDGRLVLGVGSGAFPFEWEFCGEESDPRTRGDMLDEGLDLLTALWSAGPVRHRGAHYRVDGPRGPGSEDGPDWAGLMHPPPVQRPRIPVWVAGTWPGGRPFRRAARWDGAVPMRTDGPWPVGDTRDVARCCAGTAPSSGPRDCAVRPGRRRGDRARRRRRPRDRRRPRGRGGDVVDRGRRTPGGTATSRAARGRRSRSPPASPPVPRGAVPRRLKRTFSASVRVSAYQPTADPRSPPMSRNSTTPNAPATNPSPRPQPHLAARRVATVASAVALATGITTGTAGSAEAMNPPQTTVNGVVNVLGTPSHRRLDRRLLEHDDAGLGLQLHQAEPLLLQLRDAGDAISTRCGTLQTGNAYYCSPANAINITSPTASGRSTPTATSGSAASGARVGPRRRRLARLQHRQRGLHPVELPQRVPRRLPGGHVRPVRVLDRPPQRLRLRRVYNWLAGQRTSPSHGSGANRAAWYRYGYTQYSLSACNQVYALSSAYGVTTAKVEPGEGQLTGTITGTSARPPPPGRPSQRRRSSRRCCGAAAPLPAKNAPIKATPPSSALLPPSPATTTTTTTDPDNAPAARPPARAPRGRPLRVRHGADTGSGERAMMCAACRTEAEGPADGVPRPRPARGGVRRPQPAPSAAQAARRPGDPGAAGQRGRLGRPAHRRRVGREGRRRRAGHPAGLRLRPAQGARAGQRPAPADRRPPTRVRARGPAGERRLGAVRAPRGVGAQAAGRRAPRDAARDFTEALGLWRGEPLADFAFHDFAAPEASRLDGERVSALEDRIEADLARGRHVGAGGRGRAAGREHPLRERLWGH